MQKMQPYNFILNGPISIFQQIILLFIFPDRSSLVKMTFRFIMFLISMIKVIPSVCFGSLHCKEHRSALFFQGIP